MWQMAFPKTSCKRKERAEMDGERVGVERVDKRRRERKSVQESPKDGSHGDF